MGFLDGWKEGARKALAKPLEAAGWSREFTESLMRDHEALVPEAAIRLSIEAALAEEGAELASCECRPDAVHMVIRVKRYGTQVASPVRMKVFRLVVNAQEQTVELQFASDRPLGTNLLGKIAAHLAGAFLSRMLHGQIAANRLVVESYPDEDPHRVAIDLSRLGAIRRLQAKIPILNRPALDFVSITHARHTEGGIAIQGTMRLN